MEYIYYNRFIKYNRKSLNELAIKYGVEISRTDTKHTLAKKVSSAKAKRKIEDYNKLSSN